MVSVTESRTIWDMDPWAQIWGISLTTLVNVGRPILSAGRSTSWEGNADLCKMEKRAGVQHTWIRAVTACGLREPWQLLQAPAAFAFLPWWTIPWPSSLKLLLSVFLLLQQKENNLRHHGPNFWVLVFTCAVPSCPVYLILYLEARASCLLGKYATNWAYTISSKVILFFIFRESDSL